MKKFEVRVKKNSVKNYNTTKNSLFMRLSVNKNKIGKKKRIIIIFSSLNSNERTIEKTHTPRVCD